MHSSSRQCRSFAPIQHPVDPCVRMAHKLVSVPSEHLGHRCVCSEIALAPHELRLARELHLIRHVKSRHVHLRKRSLNNPAFGCQPPSSAHTHEHAWGWALSLGSLYSNRKLFQLRSEQALLRLGQKQGTSAGLSCTTGPAHSMDVLLSGGRSLALHHEGDLIEMEPTS